MTLLTVWEVLRLTSVDLLCQRALGLTPQALLKVSDVWRNRQNHFPTATAALALFQTRKYWLYTGANWNSATICLPANQRPCSAFCAAAAPSVDWNWRYTNPCTEGILSNSSSSSSFTR